MKGRAFLDIFEFIFTCLMFFKKFRMKATIYITSKIERAKMVLKMKLTRWQI